MRESECITTEYTHRHVHTSTHVYITHQFPNIAVTPVRHLNFVHLLNSTSFLSFNQAHNLSNHLIITFYSTIASQLGSFVCFCLRCLTYSYFYNATIITSIIDVPILSPTLLSEPLLMSLTASPDLSFSVLPCTLVKRDTIWIIVLRSTSGKSDSIIRPRSHPISLYLLFGTPSVCVRTV